MYVADSFGDSVLRLDDQGMLREFARRWPARCPSTRRRGDRCDGQHFSSPTPATTASSGLTSSGVVTTVAGTGQEGATGDGGPARKREVRFTSRRSDRRRGQRLHRGFRQPSHPDDRGRRHGQDHRGHRRRGVRRRRREGVEGQLRQPHGDCRGSRRIGLHR